MVSGVSPMLQYHAKGSVVNGGTQWSFVKYVPAISHNGTQTMIDMANVGASDMAKFYQYYGFTTAICGSDKEPDAIAAEFHEDSLLIQISNNQTGLFSGWEQTVATLKDDVLGYLADEPSGKIAPVMMQDVRTAIDGVNSALWIDDYDTDVIPSDVLLGVPQESHEADWGVLYYATYLMNDADNAAYTNGTSNLVGTYLAENYNDFLNHPGIPGTLNAIFTQPTYVNEADVTDWIDNHLGNIKYFALMLNSGWQWSDVDKFAIYAYQAGFLGSYQQLQQSQYVCEEDNVGFAPNGAAGSYYGVLTDGWYYSGPVDPSTSGATLCWSLQGWVTENQYQTVYAR